jgi:pimeloyl-ACP methyl ester carboxylesterase
MSHALLSATGCSLLIAASAEAQPQRYELGRRLRVFEEQWERTPGEAAKQRCVGPLNRAVLSFFSFRLAAAARSIDEASFALENAKPSPERLWASSVTLSPQRRLFDLSERKIALELAAFYDAPRPNGKTFTLQAKLDDAAPLAAPINELPVKVDLVVAAKEGDHAVKWTILDGEQPLAEGSMRVSFVAKLKDRLDKLKAVPKEGSPAVATERATVQESARLLETLRYGNSAETDFPAVKILADAESAAAAATAVRTYFNESLRGERWMSLAVGNEQRIVPMRLSIPEKWDASSRPPLVVALHGAGGSENMFFDSYGAGKIVRLCRERGWLLVAPRVGFYVSMADTLDALHQRFPFAKRRVFLVGHSMGAAAAVQAVNADAKRYAAVVLLGGAGNLKATEDVKSLPLYVGVGAQDFALRNARSLKERLTQFGAAKLVYKEVPDAEHLGVVQQSLDDAFRFLDAVGN